MTHRRDLLTALGALALLLAGCASATHTTSAPSAPAASTPATQTAPPTTPAPTTSGTTSATPQPPAGGPVPTGFDPIAFTAISAHQFWLMGTAPCSHPVCTSIVRTTDGGAHFVGIPAPVEQANLSGPGLSSLLFADSLDGYAGSTGYPEPQPLWSTHDGGAHWHRARGDVIAFTVTSGHIFALTGRCSNGVCSQLALTRSPAAADDWTSVALPVSSGAGLPSLAASGTSVFISLTPSGGTPSRQALFVSRDGGRAFIRATGVCFAGLGGDFEASSPAVVWATCPTGMEAGAWRSPDAGAHWQALHASGAGGGLANSARIAPGGDTAALLKPGGNMALLRTTDAGAHFTKVAFPPAQRSVDWMGFTDPSTASALVSGNGALVGPNHLPSETLYRSADGGVQWHAVHIAG